MLDSGRRVNFDIARHVTGEMCRMYIENNRNEKHYNGPCDTRVRGLIIAGDITHHNYRWEGQWKRKGGARRCNSVIYDGYGNHDCSEKDGWLNYGFGYLAEWGERENKFSRRKESVGIGKLANNSWGGDDVHFVHLNLFPGNKCECVENKDPDESLKFLKRDLKGMVPSKKPVVVIHHYGFDDLSKQKETGKCRWGSNRQRLEYWEAIEKYNVIAIFTGHIHLTKNDKNWHIIWTEKGAKKEIDTFVAGGGLNGIFLKVDYRDDKIQVDSTVMDDSVRGGEYIMREIACVFKNVGCE